MQSQKQSQTSTVLRGVERWDSSFQPVIKDYFSVNCRSSCQNDVKTFQALYGNKRSIATSKNSFSFCFRLGVINKQLIIKMNIIQLY